MGSKVGIILNLLEWCCTYILEARQHHGTVCGALTHIPRHIKAKCQSKIFIIQEKNKSVRPLDYLITAYSDALRGARFVMLT